MSKHFDSDYIKKTNDRHFKTVPIGNPSVLTDRCGNPIDVLTTYIPDGSELVTSFNPTSYDKDTGVLVVPDGTDLTALKTYLEDPDNTAYFVDSLKRYYQVFNSPLYTDNSAPGKSFLLPKNLNYINLDTGAVVITEDKLRPGLATSITSILVPSGGGGLPQSFYRDGVQTDVTEDTVTPANNRPLPVKLIGVDGDVVINPTNLNLEMQTNGDYDAVTNVLPDSTGIVAHDRNATPDVTHQNKRLTALQNGDITALDIVKFVSDSPEVRSVDTASTNITSGAVVNIGAVTTYDHRNVIIFNLSAAELRLFPATSIELLIAPGGVLDTEIFIPSGTQVGLRSLATTANAGYILINLV